MRTFGENGSRNKDNPEDDEYANNCLEYKRRKKYLEYKKRKNVLDTRKEN